MFQLLGRDKYFYNIYSKSIQDKHTMYLPIHICFCFFQLLPTLDIYTWTEEHVVSVSVYFIL